MESHYKALNKELVEEVRSMRTVMSEYHTEIVRLKAQLFEAETTVIKMKTRCSSLLKTFFQDQLEILDPESSLLAYFKNGAQPVRSGRQSTLLAEQARRSSSVIQTPRSFSSTSPVRSPADVQEIQEESRNEEEMGIIMEEIESGPNPDTEESIAETTQRDISEYMANMSLACTADTTNDTNDNEAESTTPNVQALGDVTNTINQSTNRVGSSPKRREHVTVARGRYREPPGTQNHIENDTEVDEERHYTRSGKVYSFSSSLPMFSNDCESDRSATQDIFLNGSATENFLEENSSTPNTKEKSLSRPQRKCKPKSLKEMSLHSKLRRA